MAPPGPKIPAGHSFLFAKAGEYSAFIAFKYLLREGRRGLILSRTHPDEIKSRYGIECPIIWMVSRPPPGGKSITVDPVRLGKIYSLIADFAKNNPGAVILLSGIEYLISENDFVSTMKTLQLVNETIAMSGSILLLPVDPSKMDSQSFSLLEREVPSLELNVDFL